MTLEESPAPNQRPWQYRQRWMSDDSAHTLAVFRACLPRRGRKAEDDRRFLEALAISSPSRTCAGALCRSAPLIGTASCRRFDRLSEAGVFVAFFDTLASHEFYGASLSDARLDHRAARHVSAAGAESLRSPFKSKRLSAARARRGFESIPRSHANAHPAAIALSSRDIIAFDVDRRRKPSHQAVTSNHPSLERSEASPRQSSAASRASLCDKGYASKSQQSSRLRTVLRSLRRRPHRSRTIIAPKTNRRSHGQAASCSPWSNQSALQGPPALPHRAWVLFTSIPGASRS